MFKNVVKQEVLAPMLRRVGTAFAAYLVAKGFDHEAVNQLVLGLTAGASIIVDLMLSHAARKFR